MPSPGMKVGAPGAVVNEPIGAPPAISVMLEENMCDRVATYSCAANNVDDRQCLSDNPSKRNGFA
jgi:hypothetical protein